MRRFIEPVWNSSAVADRPRLIFTLLTTSLTSTITAAESARIAGAHQVVMNHGSSLAEARNTGASVLDTEYVTFLDADDFLRANFFDELKRSMMDGNFIYKPIVATVRHGIFVKEDDLIRQGLGLNTGE